MRGFAREKDRTLLQFGTRITKLILNDTEQRVNINASSFEVQRPRLPFPTQGNDNCDQVFYSNLTNQI